MSAAIDGARAAQELLLHGVVAEQAPRAEP
jgi:hypothetical protein